MKIKDVRHGLFHPHIYSGSFPRVFLIPFLPQVSSILPCQIYSRDTKSKDSLAPF